jgi:hypothetical protein
LIALPDRGNVISLQEYITWRGSMMKEYKCKAIIYEGPEDVYGPCGCGMDMATLPVLLPSSWLVEDNPSEVDEHDFCRGFDFRRVSGMSCNMVFEHEQDGLDFLANFSCCRECADRAVKCGYAVWTDKEYPMKLR